MGRQPGNPSPNTPTHTHTVSSIQKTASLSSKWPAQAASCTPAEEVCGPQANPSVWQHPQANPAFDVLSIVKGTPDPIAAGTRFLSRPDRRWFLSPPLARHQAWHGLSLMRCPCLCGHSSEGSAPLRHQPGPPLATLAPGHKHFCLLLMLLLQAAKLCHCHPVSGGAWDPCLPGMRTAIETRREQARSKIIQDKQHHAGEEALGLAVRGPAATHELHNLGQVIPPPETPASKSAKMRVTLPPSGKKEMRRCWEHTEKSRPNHTRLPGLTVNQRPFTGRHQPRAMTSPRASVAPGE